MENTDREKALEVLEAVLAKLRSDSDDSQTSSGSLGLPPHGQRTSEPVVLVVIGGQQANSNEMTPSTKTPPGDLGAVHADHPGLERFPIAKNDSQSLAPKPCFMEPARACVHSGACEMRGY